MPMDEEITIALDRRTRAALEQRAEVHGRSAGEEVAEIVRQSVGEGTRRTREELIEEFRRIRASMSPRRGPSTLELLREDRDR
jgi:plasmid stability protein